MNPHSQKARSRQTKESKMADHSPVVNVSILDHNICISRG